VSELQLKVRMKNGYIFSRGINKHIFRIYREGSVATKRQLPKRFPNDWNCLISDASELLLWLSIAGDIENFDLLETTRSESKRSLEEKEIETMFIPFNFLAY